jgi:hypothetical protein
MICFKGQAGCDKVRLSSKPTASAAAFGVRREGTGALSIMSVASSLLPFCHALCFKKCTKGAKLRKAIISFFLGAFLYFSNFLQWI